MSTFYGRRTNVPGVDQSHRWYAGITAGRVHSFFDSFRFNALVPYENGDQIRFGPFRKGWIISPVLSHVSHGNAASMGNDITYHIGNDSNPDFYFDEDIKTDKARHTFLCTKKGKIHEATSIYVDRMHRELPEDEYVVITLTNGVTGETLFGEFKVNIFYSTV